MKNWTNKKRKALKSVVRALARRVGLTRRSRRFPLPVSGKAAPPAPIPLQTSSNSQEHKPLSPRKPVHRASLAVEDGFKEF
jgi:hypothetical protein